jgi:hypothetical protein
MTIPTAWFDWCENNYNTRTKLTVDLSDKFLEAKYQCQNLNIQHEMVHRYGWGIFKVILYTNF